LTERSAPYRGVVGFTQVYDRIPCVAWNYGKAGLKKPVFSCYALWTEEAYVEHIEMTREYVVSMFAQRFRHISYGDLVEMRLPRGLDETTNSMPIRNTT